MILTKIPFGILDLPSPSSDFQNLRGENGDDSNDEDHDAKTIQIMLPVLFSGKNFGDDATWRQLAAGVGCEQNHRT